MDAINTAIIAALKKNSRIGWGTLALQVGISRQALRKRIERLEYKGQILAYTIITAHDRDGKSTPDAANSMVRAFLRIKFAKGNDCFKLARLLETYDAVIGSWAVTGTWDMVVMVEAISLEGISDLREVIVATGGIDSVQTEAIMNNLVDGSPD